MKLFIQQHQSKLILLFLVLYLYCVFYPLAGMEHIISFSLAIDLIRPVFACICVLFIILLLRMPGLEVPPEDDGIEFKTGAVKVSGLLMLFVVLLLSAKTLVADVLLIEPNRMNRQYQKAIAAASEEILAGCPSLTQYEVNVNEESTAQEYWYADIFWGFHIRNTIIAKIAGETDADTLEDIAGDILDRCEEIEKSSGYASLLLRYADSVPTVWMSTELEIHADAPGGVRIYRASGTRDDFSFRTGR